MNSQNQTSIRNLKVCKYTYVKSWLFRHKDQRIGVLEFCLSFFVFYFFLPGYLWEGMPLSFPTLLPFAVGTLKRTHGLHNLLVDAEAHLPLRTSCTPSSHLAFLEAGRCEQVGCGQRVKREPAGRALAARDAKYRFRDAYQRS